ncbi:uncharacterized protein LOC126900755 isoform X2 [Daktulosphaira vitifoliae]|nr:uncharacterized protein LOC126900755 isoform X2 [Daktulosphaira vitifoliae]
MKMEIDSSSVEKFMDFSSKNPVWKIELPYSPIDVDEDPENVDFLCEMVRNQYLKHLRQTLYDNLDVEPKKFQKDCLFQVDHCVNTCMTEMEKQALRRCLIASIYRKNMTKMINEVKTCTKNSVMYILLEQLLKTHKSSQVSKCKENQKVTLVSVGVNTENETYEIEKQTGLEDNIIYSLQSGNKDINFSTHHLKNEMIDNYDSSCLLDSTTNYTSQRDFKNNNPEFILPKIELNFVNNTKYPIKDNTGISSLLNDLQDSPELDQYITLEERLIAMGLEVDNIESTQQMPKLTSTVNTASKYIVRPNKIRNILKNKLKRERVARSYELQRSINKLPIDLQKRLTQKFDELFGTGHTYDSDPLTEEEERTIAHKRIVKLVVDNMTPYYKARRINRHLFKTLAKFISKSLMEQTYGPDFLSSNFHVCLIFLASLLPRELALFEGLSTYKMKKIKDSLHSKTKNL